MKPWKEPGKKYSHTIKSWKANWNELSDFFDFALKIGTLIYTTENLNPQVHEA